MSSKVIGWTNIQGKLCVILSDTQKVTVEETLSKSTEDI
jgi:hypothetical protein